MRVGIRYVWIATAPDAAIWEHAVLVTVIHVYGRPRRKIGIGTARATGGGRWQLFRADGGSRRPKSSRTEHNRVVARCRPGRRRSVAFYFAVLVIAIEREIVLAVAVMIAATAIMAPAATAAGESGAAARRNQQREREAGDEMQSYLCDRSRCHDALLDIHALLDIRGQRRLDGIRWQL